MWLSLSLLAFAEEPVPSAEPECFPDCSPGYLCHLGQCIEACNPACGPTERCNVERVCVAREVAPAPAVEAVAAPVPAGTGQICGLREKRFAASALKFHVAIDDRRQAILPNGSYACFDVPAGPHVLDLSTPTAGIGAVTIRTTIDIDVAPDSTRSFQCSIRGGIASPAMILTPLEAAAAEALQAKLKLAPTVLPAPIP